MRAKVHHSVIRDEELGVVRISDDCEVHANVVLRGPLILEPYVKVYPGAILGFDAESYHHASNYNDAIVVGSHSVIRESVVIQRSFGDLQTRIGERCLLMHGCHVAHDCLVEDEVTMAPYVVLAGHVRVMWKATLGIHASVHQFMIVGSLAMIGMGAEITHHVEPAAKIVGVPARRGGTNDVGLKRAGLDKGGPELAQERARWGLLCGKPEALTVPTADSMTPA